MRLPGSAVSPRCSPLRTSREAGGYAVTPARGGRGLHPHGKLSYEVHPCLAVFLETRVPFDQRIALQFLRNFRSQNAFEQATLILQAALDPSVASKARKGEFVRWLDHFDLLQTVIN